MDQPTLAASEDACGWQFKSTELRKVLKTRYGLMVQGNQGKRTDLDLSWGLRVRIRGIRQGWGKGKRGFGWVGKRGSGWEICCKGSDIEEGANFSIFTALEKDREKGIQPLSDDSCRKFAMGSDIGVEKMTISMEDFIAQEVCCVQFDMGL